MAETNHDSRLTGLLAPDLVSGLEAFIATQRRSMVEHVGRVVTHLRSTFPQIQAAWVTDKHGEALYASSEQPLDVPQAAAMMATAAALGQRFLEIMDCEALTDLRLQGEKGQIVVYRDGGNVTLVVMIPLDMNFGLLSLEARSAVTVLGHLVGTQPS